MNFNKAKVEITWSDDNVGYFITEDDGIVNWSTLTRYEQVKILNGVAQMYNFFHKFLNNE